MKLEELGFEMYGFKLGEKVMYQDKETVIIGFDIDTRFSKRSIAVQHVNGYRIPLSQSPML